EWYPSVADIGPGAIPMLTADLRTILVTNTNSMIRWSARLDTSATNFPVESRENHYFAARETDASPLKVSAIEQAGYEHEKFLFYRGFGNFGTPLKVRSEGNRLVLQNTGDIPLKHLFIYHLENDRAQVISLNSLPVGKEQVVQLNDLLVVSKEFAVSRIGHELIAALRNERLYEPEAKAMVKTWESSWFEEGLRVLYLLPEQWTEQVLAMTLDPQPQELVRVMVGRAEIIPSGTERKLVDLLLAAKDQQDYMTEDVRALLKPLGRFAPAVLQRALQQVNPTQTAPEL
ncbi:MAG: hypothetical protein ACK4UN_06045, partial [Limisphaerales bacterium]